MVARGKSKWDSKIAVYPRCIRVAWSGAADAQAFEDELRREVAEGDKACQTNGEVWLGDVRLGSLPIVVASTGRKLVLSRRTGGSIACHDLESGKSEPRVDSAEITATLVDMFFDSFRATVWCWAGEIIRKLSGFSKGRIRVNWKQALFGQGLESEEWADRHILHVWNLLRRSILTEIWWLYNRSLAEDTSRVTARYLVQQIWLSLRLHILIEWSEVVKTKDEGLAATFEKRWLTNGFAGMRTRNWVLWMWEEPLLISRLNF